MKYKLTPEMLYVSIINNNMDMVKVLLSNNINIHDNEYKCLIVACENGNRDILIYLLEFIKTRTPKSNIEKSLNTGFCKALLNNRIEIIEFILSGKYSTEENGKVKEYNIPCNTIVDNETSNWLSKKEDKEIIELLMKYNKLSNTQIFKMICCNKEFMNNFLLYI
jgi:ankyrin repeat protein